MICLCCTSEKAKITPAPIEKDRAIQSSATRIQNLMDPILLPPPVSGTAKIAPAPVERDMTVRGPATRIQNLVEPILRPSQFSFHISSLYEPAKSIRFENALEAGYAKVNNMAELTIHPKIRPFVEEGAPAKSKRFSLPDRPLLAVPMAAYNPKTEERAWTISSPDKIFSPNLLLKPILNGAHCRLSSPM
jgi:hypothetical protein